jgi:hypothetical protein
MHMYIYMLIYVDIYIYVYEYIYLYAYILYIDIDIYRYVSLHLYNHYHHHFNIRNERNIKEKGRRICYFRCEYIDGEGQRDRWHVKGTKRHLLFVLLFFAIPGHIFIFFLISFCTFACLVHMEWSIHCVKFLIACYFTLY